MSTGCSYRVVDDDDDVIIRLSIALVAMSYHYQTDINCFKLPHLNRCHLRSANADVSVLFLCRESRTVEPALCGRLTWTLDSSKTTVEDIFVCLRPRRTCDFLFFDALCINSFTYLLTYLHICSTPLASYWLQPRVVLCAST